MYATKIELQVATHDLPATQKLIAMSNSKAVPEQFKDQECKKGSCMKCPSIPYVPVIDPVLDVIYTTKEHPMKIKLSDKTKIQVPIWRQSMPEAFLILQMQGVTMLPLKQVWLVQKRLNRLNCPRWNLG